MEKIHEINESVYDINMDKLCQNSIELIKYARNITAKQVNNVQIMTYYSLGRWIVEVQQQGKHRAEYGKKIIINLSKKLTEEFGKGFSESTLEKLLAKEGESVEDAKKRLSGGAAGDTENTEE